MNCFKKFIIITAFITLPAGVTQADEDVELIDYMSSLQYFTHKLSLSVSSGNTQLISFYAHELEEVIEELEEVESYDDYPVGKHAKSILTPAFEKFEASVKSGSTNEISHRFDDVIKACNECHSTTEHGFIKITRLSDNPFMQSFEKDAPEK